MNVPDSAILNHIRTGQEEAYEMIFKSLFIPLCKYARRYVIDLEDAKDIVQFTFVKFWEIRERHTDDTNIEAYLYKSVMNNCLDWVKHEKVKINYQKKFVSEIISNSLYKENPAEQTISKELEKSVLDAVSELPDQCRKIFELSRFEEKKYHEIAESLQISIKTVETQMSRALTKLREKLINYLYCLFL